MEFSRHEYWSGQPFPSSGDLPGPGIKPGSPALQAVSSPPESLGISVAWCQQQWVVGKGGGERQKSSLWNNSHTGQAARGTLRSSLLSKLKFPLIKIKKLGSDASESPLQLYLFNPGSRGAERSPTQLKHTVQGNSLKTGTQVQGDPNTEALSDDFQQQRIFMPSQSLPVLGEADGPQTYRDQIRSDHTFKGVVNIFCIWADGVTISPKSLVHQICYSQILSGSYTSPHEFQLLSIHYRNIIANTSVM